MKTFTKCFVLMFLLLVGIAYLMVQRSEEALVILEYSSEEALVIC